MGDVLSHDGHHRRAGLDVVRTEGGVKPGQERGGESRKSGCRIEDRVCLHLCSGAGPGSLGYFIYSPSFSFFPALLRCP